MKSDFPNELLSAHASMPDSDAVLTRFQELIRQGGIAANEAANETKELAEIPAEPMDTETADSEAEEPDTQVDEATPSVDDEAHPQEEHNSSSEQLAADADEPNDVKPVEADDS
jgi:hypothetical protein